MLEFSTSPLNASLILLNGSAEYTKRTNNSAAHEMVDECRPTFGLKHKNPSEKCQIVLQISHYSRDRTIISMHTIQCKPTTGTTVPFNVLTGFLQLICFVPPIADYKSLTNSAFYVLCITRNVSKNFKETKMEDSLKELATMIENKLLI